MLQRFQDLTYVSQQFHFFRPFTFDVVATEAPRSLQDIQDPPGIYGLDLYDHLEA